MGRITGLDPAGPRCFDGPILSAIPKLHSEILCLESAAFVHVIHSNGGLEPVIQVQFQDLKLYSSLVTSIFYPGEGTVQQGCMFGIEAFPGETCSHVSP